MTWEVKCLKLQHLIISIFGSRIFKDLLDLLFSRGYLLRTLFNIQAEEGSCSDGAQQKISASKVPNFLVLIYEFLLYLLLKANLELFLKFIKLHSVAAVLALKLKTLPSRCINHYDQDCSSVN